jgi:5-methylthioribose kinase
MNEQIKLLWEEAAKTTQGDSWEEQTKFMERFAELIVKECIDYCGENLSKTVGGALKIHFGVEE